MKKVIINTIYRYNKQLIVVMTLLIALLTTGIPKIGLDYSQKSWFRQGDQLLKNYQDFRGEYGSDLTIIFVLDFNEDVFKRENMQTAWNFTNDLWQVPNLLRIDNLINFSHITGDDGDINIAPFLRDPDSQAWDQNYLDQKRSQAKNIPEFKNFLLAKDGKSLAIYGSVKNLVGSEGKVSKFIIKDIIKNIIPKYKNVKIHITGSGSLGHAFEVETISDFKLIIPVAFIVLAIILFAFLKNFTAMIISVGLVVLTLLATLGVQGWLDIKMGLVTAMCPLIVMAICIVDLVHIFSGYLRGHQEKVASPLRYTLNRNLIPTLLTSVTTIIGFLSFGISSLVPLANMGYLAAIGIALAWVFTIFLICPLLSLIHLAPVHLEKVVLSSKRFDQLANIIVARPTSILIGFSLIICLAFYLTSKNTIDSNMTNYFSKKTDFRKATDFFQEHIGSTNNVEIILKSGTADGIKDPEFLIKADKLITEIRALPEVSKANSIIDQLKKINEVIEGNAKNYVIADNSAKIGQELFFIEMSLPATKSMTQYMSIDKSDLRISIFWDRKSSQEITQGQKQIETLIQKHGLQGHLTGLAPLISGLDEYLITSFVESMIIATIAISVFMMLVFKSFFYGILCIIPNIIVPAIGAAALYLAGQSFDAGSVLLFSICLGIAIDDTIYFLTHFQRELKKKTPTKDAVRIVISRAGKTLSMTSFILMSMFALFWLGSFVPNQNFALATTIILGSALILDLVFLPALILVINKLPSIHNRLLKANL